MICKYFFLLAVYKNIRIKRSGDACDHFDDRESYSLYIFYFLSIRAKVRRLSARYCFVVEDAAVDGDIKKRKEATKRRNARDRFAMTSLSGERWRSKGAAQFLI